MCLRNSIHRKRMEISSPSSTSLRLLMIVTALTKRVINLSLTQCHRTRTANPQLFHTRKWNKRQSLLVLLGNSEAFLKYSFARWNNGSSFAFLPSFGLHKAAQHRSDLKGSQKITKSKLCSSQGHRWIQTRLSWALQLGFEDLQEQRLSTSLDRSFDAWPSSETVLHCPKPSQNLPFPHTATVSAKPLSPAASEARLEITDTQQELSLCFLCSISFIPSVTDFNDCGQDLHAIVPTSIILPKCSTAETTSNLCIWLMRNCALV